MPRSLISGGVLLAVLVTATGCASRGWVREIEGKVNQHATRIDAESKRIDGMGLRVDDLDARMGQLARHHHAANVVETHVVQFGFGRADLDDGAMTRLHELAKTIKEDSRLGVELLGFTDPRGNRDFNVALAQKRVENVRRYLVQRGVQVSRVAAVGLGPAEERNVPDAQKRRVSIHVTMAETMVQAGNVTGGSASPQTQ
jgi:outer membrane protein OmpA-like peptidoglycan-associated protein